MSDVWHMPTWLSLAVIVGWIAEQRRIWEGRTDRLESLVTDEWENRYEPRS